MGDRILVLGSGAREHSMVWKLAESPGVEKIFASPGNAGMRQIAELVQLRNSGEIGRFVVSKGIHLVVIGPETILATNLAGYLRERIGVPVFGPNARQARIETSKKYAKELMKKAGIPTAPFVVYGPESPPFTPDFAPQIPPPYV